MASVNLPLVGPLDSLLTVSDALLITGPVTGQVTGPITGPITGPVTGDDPWAGVAEMPGVGSAVAAARDGIDALLRDRGLRRTDPGTTAESLLRGAWASAVLEGSTSSEDDVRAGRTDEVAAGAVRVSAQLLSLVPVLSRSPLQALARLHALAAPSTSAAEERGRPRDPVAAQRL